MLDERWGTRSSGPNGPHPGTSAVATPAEARDWVAEFRREQAHLIRAAPRRGPTRALSCGIAAAAAAGLLALAPAFLPALLPARVSGPAGTAAPPPSTPHPAAGELTEAREEALTYDLARARQEAEAARTTHLREVEALRAEAARSEASAARAEETRATAEARSGALAQNLADARTELAAARRQAAEVRDAAVEGRERSEQLARQLAAANAEAREARAGAETALARLAQERDEARSRLAELAPAALAVAPEPERAAAPRRIDWNLLALRMGPDDAPRPTAPEPGRPEPERKAVRRTHEGAAERSEAVPRALRSGRSRAGIERGRASPGGRPAPDPRLRRPGSVEPDA